MKTKTGRVATTHVDLHGEQIALDALHDGARQRNEFAISVLNDHDRKRPPIGRAVAARVEQMEDGHYALLAEFEIFEQGDDPLTYRPLTKRLRTPHSDLVSGEMWVGDGALTGAAWQDANEIAGLLPLDEAPQKFVKKSVISTDSIVIAIGLFVVAQVAGGFLKKIGEDAYTKLKVKIPELFSRVSAKAMNLEVVFIVVDEAQRCEVRVFFDSPSVEVPADCMVKAAEILDADLPRRAIAQNGVVQLSYRYAEGELQFLYGVFSSGVPFPFDTITFPSPETVGLSVGFVKRDGMDGHS